MNDNLLQQLLQAINTLQDLGKVAYFNKGEYNSETTYEVNDVITYQGSSYVSLDNNNQGNLPTNTTYWSIVALKGEKGDTGKPFVIEKTYSSVEDMVADYDNMNINDYVMISGNIEEEQNATLWTKTETPAPTYKWVYLADFSGASGITGQTPNIQIGNVTEGNEPAVTRRQGSSNENPILDFVLKTGATGATGATGNGISSVSKTSTSGLTDTYTIAYTNGNNTTFDVTNGKGISTIAKTGTSGLVDTYTITYNDGTTSTFTITNGEDGEVTQAQLDEVQAELDRYKTLANVLPKATGEGTEVTLNNCGASLLKMQPKGNTEQDSYTGINKVKVLDKEQSTINNITYSVANEIISLSGTASSNTGMLIEFNDITLPAGTYYFYLLKTKTTRVDISLRTTNNVMIDVANFGNAFQNTLSNKSFTLSSDTVMHSINLYFPNGTDTTDTYKIMICTDSHTANEYEPFVGGSPSPSPSYPQDIRVVTGDNTINICGKNLLNITNTIDGKWYANGTISDNASWSYINQFIEVEPNTKYTISRDENEIEVSQFSIEEFNQNKIFVKHNILWQSGTNKYTVTTDSNTKYIICQYRNDYAHTNLQFNIGEDRGLYEPYQSKDYEISLGNIELCKIGTYQDYIYKENNKWYKHSEIGKVVLDGSEDWQIILNVDNSNLFRIDFTGYVKNQIIYCDNYKGLANQNNRQNFNIYLRNDSNPKLDILDNRFTTREDFNTWLSTNTPIVYYVLETPTDEEITDSTLIGQLNAINDTLSFDGQTNISSEYASGNVPAIINAEAIAKFSS